MNDLEELEKLESRQRKAAQEQLSITAKIQEIIYRMRAKAAGEASRANLQD